MLDGKAYSGRAFVDPASNAISLQLALLRPTDSMFLEFEKGVPKHAEFYLKNTEYIKQDFINNSESNLTYYMVHKGLWDVEVWVRKESYLNGKLHGERIFKTNQGKSVSLYKHGESYKEMNYFVDMGFFSSEEKLIETYDSKNNHSEIVHKKFHCDGKTVYEITESGPGYYKNRKYDLNGQLIEEKIDGKKSQLSINGKIELCLSNGKYSAEYKNGLKNGKETQFYSDGSIWFENTYLNDLQHGKSQRWYVNGQLGEECFYSNGMKDGSFRKWYENGNLWEESEYDHNRLVNQKKWYKNGEPAF